MFGRRRIGSFLPWAALTVGVVMACTATPLVPGSPSSSTLPFGSATPVPSAPAGHSPSAGPASPSAIFGPAVAVDVAVVLEADRAVQAVIPVEGGSISATGSDGSVYTLDVPADALPAETTITLTPVASVDGMPFGTQPYAVQLSPDGLSLFNYAVLTIVPAEDFPAAEQIAFGYLGDGRDVILAAPLDDPTVIQINVLHFSGNGVTKGFLADIEPERERLGGDAERQLSNAMAAELVRIRQEGGDGEVVGQSFAEAFSQFEEQVVKPRVEAAGESCAAGRLALQTILGLERQRQLLGMGGDGLEQYAGLMDKVGRVCVIEEFELCVEEHILHRMVPVWLGLQRQNELLGGGAEGAIGEARDLTTKCLTFRLDHESTGKNDLGGSSYESSVTAEVILRFNPDELVIRGEGALVNTDYEFRFPGCNVSERTGGDTFSVFELVYVPLPGASTEYDSGPEVFGHITDFIMQYHPGNSTEQATVNCPNGVSLEMPLPTWTTTFLATHIDELGENGWTAIDWEIQGGELFGEKEWSVASGTISEEGTFELHHTPGE